MQFIFLRGLVRASLVRGLVRSVPRPWTGAERPSFVDWCGAFLVRGLEWSVPRPWTGVERPWPSREALKAGRCSELDATPNLN